MCAASAFGTADRDPTWSIDTAVVHVGRPAREPGAPLNVPMEPASTFHAAESPGAHVEYARDGTRAAAALESAMGDLEGGTAVSYSSGMAAASAILDRVPLGGIVVAPHSCYAGVAARLRYLSDEGRITLRSVEIADTDAVVQALPGAHLLWIESPTNPLMHIADIPALTEAAHRMGVQVVCDNTFATPMSQRPLSLGADFVLHSATKFIGGHSDLLAGIVVTADPDAAADLVLKRITLGSMPGTLEVFLALRGLRTLALRWSRAQSNAAILAQRLSEHPAISRVRYPGLPTDPGFTRMQRQMHGGGAVLSVEIAAGAAAAQQVCERTRLWVHSTSLGGVESLIERRRRWAAETPEVPESLIRLSVGIEDVEDLWTDLNAALH
jgi:cystathionine gamma-synthase